MELQCALRKMSGPAQVVDGPQPHRSAPHAGGRDPEAVRMAGQVRIHSNSCSAPLPYPGTLSSTTEAHVMCEGSHKFKARLQNGGRVIFILGLKEIIFGGQIMDYQLPESGEALMHTK